jgi:hypothetical protein
MYLFHTYTRFDAVTTVPAEFCTCKDEVASYSAENGGTES